MGRTLREKLDTLSPEHLDRVVAETDRLHDEYRTLQELRKAKALTQVELAKILRVKQASIAQLEKRSDLMISTLRNYVEAMGGKLSFVVEFPDQASVVLDGLGDTEEPRVAAS